MNRINSILMLALLSQILVAQDSKESLAKALSYVSTGNSFSSLGNYASISPTEGKIKGSIYHINKRESSMYTIDFSTGSSDGISVLFDEGKINSKTSLGAEYRIILSNLNPLIGSNKREKEILELDKKKELDDFNDKVYKLIELYKSDKVNFTSEDKLKMKKKKLEMMIKNYNELTIEEKVNLSNAEKSILVKIQELEDDIIKKMGVEIDSNYFNSKFLELSSRYKNKIQAIDKKLSDLKPASWRFSFVSFGYSASREDFVLFADSLESKNQLVSKDYVSHKVKLAYNFISNVLPKTLTETNKVFFSVGAEFGYSNNLKSLTKIEVVDTKIIDSTRTTVLRQNAFEGKYREDIRSLNLFVDYYQFLQKSPSSIALHLAPQIIMQDFQRPVSSLQLGFLVPFKAKDKAGSIVNIEFYYRIKDLFNTTDNENALLNRNQIGLQTTFPFNF